MPPPRAASLLMPTDAPRKALTRSSSSSLSSESVAVSERRPLAPRVGGACVKTLKGPAAVGRPAEHRPKLAAALQATAQRQGGHFFMRFVERYRNPNFTPVLDTSAMCASLNASSVASGTAVMLTAEHGATPPPDGGAAPSSSTTASDALPSLAALEAILAADERALAPAEIFEILAARLRSVLDQESTAIAAKWETLEMVVGMELMRRKLKPKDVCAAKPRIAPPSPIPCIGYACVPSLCPPPAASPLPPLRTPPDFSLCLRVLLLTMRFLLPPPPPPCGDNS